MATSRTSRGPLHAAPASAMAHGPAAPSSAGFYSHDTGLELGEPLGGPSGSATASAARRQVSVGNSLPWRRRPKSLALGNDDLSRNFGELALGEEHEDANIESPKSGDSLKGRIRRASMSLKGIVRRDRRVSEPGTAYHDARPVTSHSAWHRLRQAASFRHARTSHGGPGHLQTIYSPAVSEFPGVPVPGHGLAPPIIPRHTGAAAKAAAAMQNEYMSYYARYKHELIAPDEYGNDRESGIGITFASASQIDVPIDQGASIVRRDFVAQLPTELAVQIMSYLDAFQLATASRVCRFWHHLAQDQHIWRQSFLREKTHTCATTRRIQPGTGAGVPPLLRPGNDWQQIYRAREELDRRWKKGKEARAVYLNGHMDSIYCLQFDENKIITGSRDKTIRIWDMRSLDCLLVIGPPEVVNDEYIFFDQTGHPSHYALFPHNQRIKPSVPVTVSFPVHHKASILCLQFDDEILVTGSSDSTCIVYKVQSGYRPVRRLQFHTAAVLDLAFDKKHIVTCSKDASICIWDRASGALLKQLKGHTAPVNAVQLRGNSLVSCSGDSTVNLWNIDSGKVIREFAGHSKGLACSQFSEDGRYVASAGSDKAIRIWDANTGECIREIEAHQSLVRSLHIDSISGRLISGSYDTDIKVFDIETGEQLLDFPGWHASWVLSAKSDYRRIVSTGQDAKILVMDFGADVPNIGMLESRGTREKASHAGFI
ncbi:WD40-repeat-containing domain protein [Durotheca rogersii]|uniref:WD40-repeat-containing domain protein n=1 Tax=Durotheca rogersii TaxID=419775 RepID=UPI0022206668|nr:WD40-repeat-containing domain protein [Durotheca rogersii]KAI5860021.1 WD40-repeat-containing domain protein [Durotheca rogersii]